MSLPVPNVFSNNAAFDFLGVLADNPTWEVARDAFRAVADYPADLEYDDGAYVLVAAALLAAKKTGEPQIPDQCRPLIEALGEPPADIIPLAQTAFRIAVQDQTRLADQHLPPEPRAIWGDYISSLERAIGQVGS